MLTPQPQLQRSVFSRRDDDDDDGGRRTTRTTHRATRSCSLLLRVYARVTRDVFHAATDGGVSAHTRMRHEEPEATRRGDLNDEARDDGTNPSRAHGVETLEIERTRALTSLKHLIRSNEALEGELAGEGEDDATLAEEDKAAYASAVDENKRAIANVQERIYALSREIAQITGADVSLGADDESAREVNGGQQGAWV